MKSLTFAIASMLAWLVGSAAQAAVTCNISGYIRYEPQDRYYCDSNHLTCTGWTEVNLDRYKLGDLGPKPQRFMRLVITDSAGNPLKVAFTDSNGFYSTSVSLNAASCTGQTIRVRREYARVHEADLAVAAPRYRFKMTKVDKTTLRATPSSAVLTGASSTVTVLQRADREIVYNAAGNGTENTANGAANAALNNVYYVVNSAATAAAGWWSTLSDRLAGSSLSNAQAIVYDASYTGTATYCESGPGESGAIFVRGSDYATGFTIRHEYGHRIHQVLHSSQQGDKCFDYTYGGSPDGSHLLQSCEYGFVATSEGLANFFAVRTVTTGDNAWMCYLGSGAAQDGCSVNVKGQSAVPSNDPDGDGVEASPAWYALVGDSFANAAARCAIPKSSCTCGANCAGVRASHGHRLEVQVARFLWDMVDSNNESNLDDTTISMSSLLSAFAGMTCAGSADGSCNEPNIPDPNSCTAKSRDLYNPYDIGDLLAGDQSQERTLNCVANATDT